MSGKASSQRLSLALILAIAAFALYFATRPDPVDETSPPEPTVTKPELADLGDPPDWELLFDYEATTTRSEFEKLLTEVFTIGDDWKQFLQLEEDQIHIRTLSNEDSFPMTLKFRSGNGPTRPSRFWRTAEELPPAEEGKPLSGVHIAIDAGHIGGEFAQIEERWFQIGEGKPVMEGEMTLAVAKLLKPQLEALGAKATLIRETNAPVTELRREHFEKHAREKLRTGSQRDIESLSERLFYRTAEIRTRAKMVNETIHPDLVVCLHFNAESWGDPADPQLTDANHFHIILNGAYTASEIAHDDERFEMLLKLLQGTHQEEAALASAMAKSFAQLTKLPPYLYKPNSRRAVKVDNNSYLWARNLLANRLYRCPVLFLEPYVMNSNEVYERIQAGDYDGTRLIAGKERLSIFREYAISVTNGLVEHFRENRSAKN